MAKAKTKTNATKHQWMVYGLWSVWSNVRGYAYDDWDYSVFDDADEARTEAGRWMSESKSTDSPDKGLQEVVMVKIIDDSKSDPDGWSAWDAKPVEGSEGFLWRRTDTPRGPEFSEERFIASGDRVDTMPFTTVPAEPIMSKDDLATINAHRRGLGMKPLDPADGWTAKEIADMAESIRSKGTMANPKRRPKGKWEHVGGGCVLPPPKKRGSKKRGPKYVCDDEYRNEARGESAFFVSTIDAHFKMPTRPAGSLRGIPKKGAKRLTPAEATKRRLMSGR